VADRLIRITTVLAVVAVAVRGQRRLAVNPPDAHRDQPDEDPVRLGQLSEPTCGPASIKSEQI
jgi:hypothetical protein